MLEILDKKIQLDNFKNVREYAIFRTKQQIRVEIFERNIFFDKMNKNVGF